MIVPTIEDVRFRFGNVIAKHGTRLLVLTVVLALYAGGAAAESSDLLVEPTGDLENGNDGPHPDE